MLMRWVDSQFQVKENLMTLMIKCWLACKCSKNSKVDITWHNTLQGTWVHIKGLAWESRATTVTVLSLERCSECQGWICDLGSENHYTITKSSCCIGTFTSDPFWHVKNEGIGRIIHVVAWYGSGCGESGAEMSRCVKVSKRHLLKLLCTRGSGRAHPGKDFM